jgi:hypothetical protein
MILSLLPGTNAQRYSAGFFLGLQTPQVNPCSAHRLQ